MCLFFPPSAHMSPFTGQSQNNPCARRLFYIQDAIYNTMNGDTVMIAPGRYYQSQIDFLGRAITVMGSDPADCLNASPMMPDREVASTAPIRHTSRSRTILLPTTTAVDNSTGHEK